MKILAIRHPESLFNKLGRHQGQYKYEPGLSELGFKQTVKIVDFLQNFHILKLYSSPLPRAVQLAYAIKNSRILKLKIFEEPELMEISNGLADGLPVEKIKEIFPESWEKHEKGILDEPCFPKGESIREAAERGIRVLRKIARQSFSLPENHYESRDAVVIISHGTLLEATLATIAGVDLRKRRDFHQKNGCINFIRYTWMGFEVVFTNFTDHLYDTYLPSDIEL